MNPRTQIVPALPPDWPMMATYEEVAELLRVSKSALYHRVRAGMCPSPVRQGASSRFSKEQVELMMEGVKPRGTFKPTFSVRAKGGKKGGKKAQKLRKVRKANVSQSGKGRAKK